MKLGEPVWFKWLLLQSDLPPSPEKHLLARVVALAIGDEEMPGRVPDEQRHTNWQGGFGKGWFNPTLRLYCEMLNIDPQVVLEQVQYVRMLERAAA